MFHIAIVGTGNIAPSHVEGLLMFPQRCRIVALVDIYPEKAQAMKEKYHIDGAEIFDSHEKMLKSAFRPCRNCDQLYERGKTCPGGKAHGAELAGM